ncbi:hypothetical protein ACFQX4_25680 [Roseomonas sp. GCM10028921]
MASFTSDGAYDRDDVYAGVAAQHPAAGVIVSPRSGAVRSDTAGTVLSALASEMTAHAA